MKVESEYFIIKNGDISGGDVLVSKNSYTYAKSTKYKGVNIWKCRIEGCDSFVKELNNCYFTGLVPHKHPSSICDVLIAKILRRVSIFIPQPI